MGDNFALGFVVGSVTGFIAAGFVGFIASRILWHWGRVNAIRKPQTIKSNTEKTSCQVVIDGCKSLLLLIILITLILVGMLLCGSGSAFGWEEVLTFVRSVAQP